MSDSTIDLATFRALQQTSGHQFVSELAGTFLEEAPHLLGQMRAALAEREADAFRRAAHSLKSNAITFGALALGAKARELELKGLEQVLMEPAAPMEALEQEYSRTAAALAELRDA